MFIPYRSDVLLRPTLLSKSTLRSIITTLSTLSHSSSSPLPIPTHTLLEALTSLTLYESISHINIRYLHHIALSSLRASSSFPHYDQLSQTPSIQSIPLTSLQYVGVCAIGDCSMKDGVRELNEGILSNILLINSTKAELQLL